MKIQQWKSGLQFKGKSHLPPKKKKKKSTFQMSTAVCKPPQKSANSGLNKGVFFGERVIFVVKWKGALIKNGGEKGWLGWKSIFHQTVSIKCFTTYWGNPQILARELITDLFILLFVVVCFVFFVCLLFLVKKKHVFLPVIEVGWTYILLIWHIYRGWCRF